MLMDIVIGIIGALIDIHHALDWRFSQGGLITILVAVLLTALVGMIRGTSTA